MILCYHITVCTIVLYLLHYITLQYSSFLASPYLSRPLSLAIPPWIGAMSTGDGFGHLWEETAPLKLRLYGTL